MRLVILALLCLGSAAGAEESPLAGLCGVPLFVRIHQGEERYGPSEEWLKARAAAVLKRKGVSQISHPIPATLQPGQPALVVDVITLRAQGDQVIYTVQVRLQEYVRPEREPDRKVWAVTWDSNPCSGHAPRARLGQALRTALERQVAAFGAEYRAANP